MVRFLSGKGLAFRLFVVENLIVFCCCLFVFESTTTAAAHYECIIDVGYNVGIEDFFFF